MDFPRKNVIPPNILGHLRPLFVSPFTEYIEAQIVTSLTDVKFLRIPLPPENGQNLFAFVELSADRFQEISGGGMPVIYPFLKPEKRIVLCCTIG